ncbi:MAG: SlyX protein [Moraxellaceae bacterium]|nr:MAG: SlyX protein [Moraxellaceae bacterium]
MEAQALEDKIVDLEIRLSHQDDMLLSLNDVIVSQQQQIALLEKQVQHLGRQMTAVRQSDPGPMIEDSPPPHY